MTVQRGDVVIVNFPFSAGTGSSPRPALVVQSDHKNQRISNTIVAMITRTTHRAAHEDTQLLIDVNTPEGKQSGLMFTSALTCENLATVHEQLITHKIGRLPPAVMQQVDECLKASLGL